MKKILAGFFLVAFLVSIGGFVYGTCQYGDPPKTCPDCPKPGGLVPCGRSCDDPDTDSICECEPCTLCDFFVMLDRMIDFALLKIVPSLAALMIAIGGGMYILSFGDPEKLSQVKKLFTSIVIGILIIYGAFLIIGIFLSLIGLASGPVNWHDFYQSWWKDGIFRIDCH